MQISPTRTRPCVRHRLRFTVFCPNQTSEWVRGVTGMIESFDVEFFVDEARRARSPGRSSAGRGCPTPRR